MNNRIIFFDIDKTLFDREKYLGDFFKLLESEHGLSKHDVDEIGDYYRYVKEEYGFFSSEAFLARIYKNFPNLNEKLDYYFSQENLDSFLYEDCKILSEIKNSRIGIFSKGDYAFQKAKITSFENLIEEDLIYIFHNKLEKIQEIISNFSDSELIFVDDNIAVLLKAKDINPKIKTILIDRTNEFGELNNVDFKIESLSDIIPILHE